MNPRRLVAPAWIAGALLLTGAAPAAGQTGIQFNGTNQYVTFGTAPALGASQFTVECWFKRTGAGATTTTGTGGVTSAIPLVTKGRGEAEGSSVDMNWFLGLRSTDSVLVADYEEGAGQTSPGLNHPIAGVSPVRSHVWYHAAVTFDGTTLRLYLNGKLESTVAVGANRLPRFDSIQHAALGSALTSAGTAAGFFAGAIDEPRVWNLARTQGEIQGALAGELIAGAGLLGRWGLNEGAGTTAANSVAGGPNGTLTNAPAWVTGSRFSTDYGLFMDGTNGYATFAANAALGLGTFTIETWFRRDGAGVATSTGSGGISAVPLLTKGRAESDGSVVDMNWFLGIRATDHVLVADFEEGAGGATPGLNHPVAGVTAIPANGAWHHAAATYDGATWTLYLDGLLETTLAVGQPPQSASTQHAALGSALTSAGAAAGFFHGALDEARVWSVARSIAEIQADVNTALGGSHPGLVARWGMNEATGTAIASSAAGAVTGALTGTGVTWTHGAPFNLTFAPPAPPADPTGLSATALAYNTIQLAWNDVATDETSYEVERSTAGAGGPFALLATLAAGATGHADAPLAPAAEYCYRVRAVNAAGPSGWTAVECVTTPAEPNQALDFPGSGAYVTFGAAPALNSAAFTVECWFRREGPGAGTNTGTGGIPDAIPLVAKGRAEAENANADINYLLAIRASDGVLCADFEEAQSGAAPGLNHPLAGVTPIAADAADHHAAVTYDGTTMHLYLDGCLEATSTVGAPANAANVAHAAIGSALTTGGAAAGFFDGRIDEVRIWGVARTEAEIQAGMLGPLAGPVPGLLGGWGLNEAIGTTAYDRAGLSPGTLVGAIGRVAGAPFADVVPPTALVLSPNGGESLDVGTVATLTWNASDCLGVASVDLHLSRSGTGGPWDPIATGLPNTGSHAWTVTGPHAVGSCVLRVVAHDSGNSTADESDAPFTIFDLATPTLLATLTAEARPEGIAVRWRFTDPASVASVRIERGEDPRGPWVAVPAAVHPAGALLEALDATALGGRTYWYRLVATGRDGEVATFGPVSATAIEAVTDFALGRPSPNPGPGPIRFEVALPRESRVRLTVTDVMGRAVATLADGVMPAGRHPMRLERRGATALASGVYFLRLEAAGRSFVRRLVIAE